MAARARLAYDFRFIRLFTVEAAIGCAVLYHAIARNMHTDFLVYFIGHAVSPPDMFP